MTPHTVLAAILFLAPHLGMGTARLYSRLIRTEASRYHVDPMLVVAIIHVETAKTWDPALRSATDDRGLMQVHVSASSNPGLVGREDILFNPKVGIHYGVKTLAMWQAFHKRACLVEWHPYWGHYQYGYLVRSLAWSWKVRELYLKLQVKALNMMMVVLEEHPSAKAVGE